MPYFCGPFPHTNTPRMLLMEVQKKTGKPRTHTTTTGGRGEATKKTQQQRWDGGRRNQKPRTQGVLWDTLWQNLPKLVPAAPGRGPVFPRKYTIGTNAGLSHWDGSQTFLNINSFFSPPQNIKKLTPPRGGSAAENVFLDIKKLKSIDDTY